MNRLQKNWIVDKGIDFELKKYVLLAYLQKVDIGFSNQKLFPFLKDLKMHKDDLCDLKSNLNDISVRFEKEAVNFSIRDGGFNYESLVTDDMDELKEIIDYSLQLLLPKIDKGDSFFEEVLENIKLEPIGLQTAYNQYGYLFLTYRGLKQANIFEYQKSIYYTQNQEYPSVKFNFLGKENISIHYTVNTMKKKILSQRKDNCLPSFFLMEVDQGYPFEETFVPVANYKMSKYIS